MDYELIIFDCDGVLVDSEPLADELLRDALADHGLEMTVAQVVETYVGRSMSAVVSISEQMLGRKLPDDFLDVLQVKTFAIFEKNLKAVDGVEKLIIGLKEHGKKICVASSGSFEKMDVTLGLTGLRDYFDNQIYNSSQVKRGKPYPDLYLYAAEQMQVEQARCLVIEDSLPGVQGAVAAGMEVIAYSVRGDDDKLKRAGGLVFGDMNNLLGHIV
ncbi:MAG: HAD family phosphatase [Emcibacteraceae bacterium]|nr:HAD family phosphatase [Emcibacteraceae bacterium]